MALDGKNIFIESIISDEYLHKCRQLEPNYWKILQSSTHGFLLSIKKFTKKNIDTQNTLAGFLKEINGVPDPIFYFKF